ncbi:hypothetical protein PAI11_37350 [Patulibacter medicamentivorans]|uniref:Uncharacterized protein n=1 Tax=Patulibacter medicamentivorans TaxID=1097667 RepID=H0EA61_9ACTN|nr:hypothetical protein PAI11_37350 [Patulibacter medicamentivorans]
MRDLDERDGRGAAWDEATLLVAASHHTAAGRKATTKTLDGLGRRCLIHRRQSDGRYVLTTAGRVRLREGL